MLRNTDFLTKKQGFIGHPEHGGAIIMILLMVAIFAALNYVVSSGSRTGSATISKEQAAIAATEILDYGRAIKQAVQTLQINGCSDTEISFENSKLVGYTNPNSPSDKSCHVFDVAGGGVNYQKSYTNDWTFSGATSVKKIGNYQGDCPYYSDPSSCAELMMQLIIPETDIEICSQINKKLFSDNSNDPDPNPVWTNSAPFAGSYTGTHYLTSSAWENKMSGCYRAHTSANFYYFFQVLIAR